MKNILTIFLKELKRVFADRRMLISLFLPGVLIFAIYSFMGNFMQNNVLVSKTKDTVFEIVYTDNYSADTSKDPTLLSYLDMTMINGNSTHYQKISPAQVEEYKTKLHDKEIHLVITYSDNFEDLLGDNSKKATNNICLFYNGESTASSDLYVLATAAVQTSYVNYLQNVQNGEQVAPNVGKKDSITMQIMSFVFPMLTVSVLFSTVVSLCPEAIAGEKERGTLASLFLTPIKRSEFAIGKITSLSVLCIASGTITFLGLIFSLPKLLGGASISFGLTPVDILLLFLIIISTLLLFVAIGITISAFSNTIKEATSYLSPLMIVLMILGIIPASTGAQFWHVFVPILNLSSCMSALLMGSANLPLLFGITIAVNTLLTVLLIFLITKLFEKERVILGQ